MVVGLPGYLREWLIYNDFYGKLVGKYTRSSHGSVISVIEKNTAFELEIVLINFLLRSSR